MPSTENLPYPTPSQDDPTVREEVRREWRAGWPTVLGCAICLGSGFPSFAFVSSLFVEPLTREFGWSRSEQAVGQMLAVIGAMMSPAVGSAVDRYGVRAVAFVFLPLLGLANIGLATMNGDVARYYVLMAMLTIAGQGSTAVVYLRAVASRFDRSRALALAMSRLGIAAAGAGMPVLLFHVMHTFGWRAGYFVLALLALLLCLPVTFLLVREGSPCADRTVVTARARAGAGYSFVALCIALALAISSVTGLLAQLHPILVSKGVTPSSAAAMVALLSVSVATGAVLTGLLADRLWAPLLGCLFTAFAGVGCAALIGPAWLPGDWGAILSVALIGFAQGAELDLAGYLIARYHGLEHFSRLFGISLFAVSIVAATTTYGFAALFDRFGSYDPALLAAALAFGASSLTFLTLGPYPSPPNQER